MLTHLANELGHNLVEYSIRWYFALICYSWLLKMVIETNSESTFKQIGAFPKLFYVGLPEGNPLSFATSY